MSAALATATADGRPIVGPVDGIFFRGSFHFGSAPDSIRFRHIHEAAARQRDPPSRRGARRHGAWAAPSSSTCAARRTLTSGRRFLDIYVPRYGPEWERFLDSGPLFARIEADKMFTFHMEVADQAG